MDEHQLFAEWKGYQLPPLDDENRYHPDWMNREFIAFKAGLARQQSTKQAERIAKLEAALDKAVKICDELEVVYLNSGHTAAQEAMLCAATSDMREAIRALINAENTKEALED